MNDASPDDAACNNLTSHEGRQGCTKHSTKIFWASLLWCSGCH